MKKHTWVVEEIDGGHLGSDDFWICKECEASGGPVWGDSAPSMSPFYADGSGLEVGHDCDAAKALISRHKEIKA